MSKFIITSKEQAETILEKYYHCTTCSECGLRDEGWRCGYLAEQAQKYLEGKNETNEKL